MHPLLMTLTTIPAEMRSKLSNNAWVCVAYLPVAKFLVHPSYQGILANRVLHEAMDIVTENLKHAAAFGKEMADGFGNVRIVYPPVVALSGDLIEHLSMAAVSASTSPVSFATSAQFGNGVTYPRRTKRDTLKAIKKVAERVDPWELHDFARECGKVHLNGVHLPWWRNFNLVDPSIFCCPDLLHSGYKLFFDHFHKACQIAVGAEELDRRFAIRHRRIGYGALRRVSEVKQMTGRMQREMMRATVVAIQGAVSPSFQRAIRAIVDFLLMAQAPRHTPASLARMETHLRTFHEHKDAIALAGGRGTLGHWRIPKLELLTNFVRAILTCGTLSQWSTEAVEHLIRTEGKRPFQLFTNHHRSDFAEQCARHLDRVEKLRQFELFALLKTHGVAACITPTEDELLDDVELHDAASRGLVRTWIESALPGTGFERFVRAPRTVRNLFATGSLSETGSRVAFHINKKPTGTYSLFNAAVAYGIPDLYAALCRYMQDAQGGTQDEAGPLPFDRIHVWEKYRIQLLSTFDDTVRLDPETLRAIPPNSTYPFGMCDPVLVDSLRADGELRAEGKCTSLPFNVQ